MNASVVVVPALPGWNASAVMPGRFVLVVWPVTKTSLLAFDVPSREECVADRSRSNIPQQALTLMNDPSFVEAFRVFAARAMTECSGSDSERIVWMWQHALQRDPSAEEQRIMLNLLAEQRVSWRAVSADPKPLLSIGQSPPTETLDLPELAAWTHVARVLLNLHESITRN